MKFANSDGRAVLVLGDEIADLARASDGALGPDPMSLYEDWSTTLEVAGRITVGTGPLVEAALANPVPMPRQVLAIGLNYRDHAEETGLGAPEIPAVFTKFPTSLAGPFDDVALTADRIDWEVELVVVIGRHADHVSEAEAWAHVAGLTVGQDISDRHLQFAAAAQFSLGKSGRGFGPMGPWVVTPDEFADPDDLGIGCSIDGEVVQDARTNELIFTVPRLIADLSAVVALLPGDVIFTGTPSGVGFTRQPPRYLEKGQVIESWIEGIGTMRNRCM